MQIANTIIGVLGGIFLLASLLVLIMNWICQIQDWLAPPEKNVSTVPIASILLALPGLSALQHLRPELLPWSPWVVAGILLVVDPAHLLKILVALASWLNRRILGNT